MSCQMLAPSLLPSLPPEGELGLARMRSSLPEGPLGIGSLLPQVERAGHKFLNPSAT